MTEKESTERSVLPTSEDDLMVQEILGCYGEGVKQTGLLRLLAHETQWLGSTQLARRAGVDQDIRKLGRFRSVLSYAKNLGLVDEKSVNRNYHIYKLSERGYEQLIEANDVLDEFGWGWHPAKGDPHASAWGASSDDVSITETTDSIEPEKDTEL